jgi:adenylate cyclase
MKISGITEKEIKNAWHSYLTTGNLPSGVKSHWFEHKSLRPLVKLLPKSPRCDICYFPFKGIGGFLSDKLLGLRSSNLNPHLCNLCERFATEYHGGIEIEMAVVFVDVRNSTPMAEKMSAEQFSKLINRFYHDVTESFYHNYGLVQKFQGDEVGGFFVPGIAGTKFVAKAVMTGKQALEALGYGTPSGPWIDAGVGIHTGIAYAGSIAMSNGVTDISILGDTVNTAARLTSHANRGEIIISEATRINANLSTDTLEQRKLTLKGKSEEMMAWVITI